MNNYPLWRQGFGNPPLCTNSIKPKFVRMMILAKTTPLPGDSSWNLYIFSSCWRSPFQPLIWKGHVFTHHPPQKKTSPTQDCQVVTWRIQWLFLVPLNDGRWHIIPQLAVYTTYIPLIYCLSVPSPSRHILHPAWTKRRRPPLLAVIFRNIGCFQSFAFKRWPNISKRSWEFKGRNNPPPPAMPRFPQKIAGLIMAWFKGLSKKSGEFSPPNPLVLDLVYEKGVYWCFFGKKCHKKYSDSNLNAGFVQGDSTMVPW